MSSSSAVELYYTPTSCGAANFISSFVGKVPVNAFEVDIRSHTVVKTGEDFYKINPKGNVPSIRLPNGTLLNENVATLLYLTENATNDIGPKEGADRIAYVNLLALVATEVHQAYGPAFRAGDSAELKKFAHDTINRKLKMLEEQYLHDKDYLFGNKFTAADAYLSVCLSWSGYVGVSLDAYPKLSAYVARINGLEQVAAARKKMAELGEEQRKK